MTRWLALLLMLCPGVANAAVVGVKQMPDGCLRCDGWLFTYSYQEMRPHMLRDAKGNSLHQFTTGKDNVTFQYFVNNKAHNNEDWAATESEARAIADRIAVTQGVK